MPNSQVLRNARQSMIQRTSLMSLSASQAFQAEAPQCLNLRTQARKQPTLRPRFASRLGFSSGRSFLCFQAYRSGDSQPASLSFETFCLKLLQGLCSTENMSPGRFSCCSLVCMEATGKKLLVGSRPDGDPCRKDCQDREAFDGAQTDVA